MAIMNDGVPLCDVCNVMCSDPVMIELWPQWQHDPGFHVCLRCLRRAYADQYLADIAAMDALARPEGT
jgi:hypothetical protein